jgi:hypothetical protein
MTMRNFSTAAFAAGLIGIAGILPASAELPSMNEKDWLGYFVGLKTRSYMFGITPNGRASIKVLNEKGDPVAQKLTIQVDFKIEETMPDGKVIGRLMKPESLESAQAATNKPKDVVFKGLATGDIGFEVFVTEERGGIALGGRLLEPGALKNPSRFCISVKVPNAYPDVKVDEDKKAKKAFEDKVKGDRVQISRMDGKREKLSMMEPVAANSPEVTGPGLSGVQIDASSYKDRKIQFSASPNSSIALSNPSKQPLGDGFDLVWKADPAKDPEGKARLQIEVK